MSGSTTGTSITLTSSNSLIAVGMTVTGTGITNSVTVSSIDGTSLVLSGTPGGTVSGTLTFVGAGVDVIQKTTGLIFATTNPNDEENIASLTIADVNKKINANSTGSTITLLTNTELDDAVGNVVGLYEGVTTVKSGTNLENLTVNTVNSSNSTAVISETAVARSGQLVVFENAGRVANISFVLGIDQFPTANTTISLNLDNFLTIDPNWS